MRIGFSAALWISLVILIGCAGSGKNTSSTSGNASFPNRDLKNMELDSIRNTLTTFEDSLILDLMISYQYLLVHSENPSSLDRTVLRHGRSANNQLEYMLRKGGVKNRTADNRFLALNKSEPATMRDFIEQLRLSLLKPGTQVDWKTARDRALEIQRQKWILSALVEDAGWCLAVADFMDSNATEEVKSHILQIHQGYAKEIPQSDLVKLITDNLPLVADERLQREMKKLANRSWERDKRKGKGKESTTSVPTQSISDAKTVMPTENPPIEPVKKRDDSLVAKDKARVDTLSIQGHYLEALRVLDLMEDEKNSSWVQEHRRQLGERYCDERRAKAAAAFSAAKKTKQDSTRIQLLHQSLQDLDSCLLNFPDNPVSAKVRRNREIVEKELKK